MSNLKFLPLFTVILLGCGVWLVSGEIDVTAEINRVETQLKHMKAPPELIANVLQQLQTQCKKNRTIDQSIVNNASKCMEKHFNETQLISDIKQAIPEGKLDNVFHDMCVKWPKIKGCLSEFFVIIEDCWDKGNKVNKAVDESVKFFCGEDNDGAKIAMFLAEGGMECLEKHGDSVKTCIESKHDIPQELPEDINTLSIPNKDQICEVLNDLKDCTSKGLKKCKDSTPENLATSMIKQVGRAVDCRLKGDLVKMQAKSVNAGASADFNNLMGWMAIGLVGTLVL